VFDDLKAGRPVQWFKSHRDGIATATTARFHLGRRCGAGGDVAPCTPDFSGIFQCLNRHRPSVFGIDACRPIRSRAQAQFNISTCPAIRGSLPVLHPAMPIGICGRRRATPLHRRWKTRSDVRKGTSLPRSVSADAQQTTKQMFDFWTPLSHRSAARPCSAWHLMLDYSSTECRGFSPEAPAPVIASSAAETNIGGGRQWFARNITSLGARCIFVGLSRPTMRRVPSYPAFRRKT